MSENPLRDKALKRIKALLNKTEENGASYEESISAMEKANQLMKEYYITINEVDDLKDDPIITEATDRIKIKERETQLFPIICDLLDLRHFYNKSRITFVGYSVDVKVGVYLYRKVMNGLLYDLEKFKNTTKYAALKINYHPNTLRRDFISGWIDRIGERVYELLYERTSSLRSSNKTGLMVIKRENVDKKFAEFDVSTVRFPNNPLNSMIAYNDGKDNADQFNLQNDLDTNEIPKAQII